MKSPLVAVLLPACLAAVLNAQISIDPMGPVNAASYVPNGLPNSGVARGGLFIIKGTNLCPPGYATAQPVSVAPLPKILNDVRMDVNIRGVNTSVFMIYTYGGLKDADGKTFDQIAALLPSSTPEGEGILTVYYDKPGTAGFRATVGIKVIASNPGIFTLSQSGRGAGVITDNQSFQANTVARSFNESQWVNMWVTGLGPLLATQPDNTAPPFGNIGITFDLFVGGMRVDLQRIGYRGRAPGFPGLDQIQFLPPPGITGCAIPVYIRSGLYTSNTVTISLSPTAHCQDRVGPTSDELNRIASGLPVSIGHALLNRVDLRVYWGKDADGINRATDGTLDLAHAHFSRFEAAYAPFSEEVIGPPSLGQCVVQTGKRTKPWSLEHFLAIPPDPVPQTALGAGTFLTLTGPGSPGSRQVAGPTVQPAPSPAPMGSAMPMFQTAPPGYYYSIVGGRLTTDSVSGLLSPFYEGGNYALQTQGVAGGVGLVNTAITVPATNRLEWVDAGRPIEVHREGSYTMRWKGGDPATEFVLIYGYSEGTTQGGDTVPYASFQCSVPANNLQSADPPYIRQFTIPAAILAQLPLSKHEVAGILSISTVPFNDQGRFSAQGLDFGRLQFRQTVLRSVTYY